MSALKTKPNARTLLALATFVAGIALTGCGKSNGGNAAGTVINPLTGQVGLVGTGGCVPITQAVQTGIPVVMQNIYMDSANIVGGLIPGVGQQVGAVGIGGGQVAGMYRRSSPYGSIALDLNNLGAYGGAYSGLPYSGYPAQSMWGQTQTGNLAWGSTGAYPYGYNNTATGNQTATGQGIITLSSTAMQAILYKIQTGELQIGVNPQIAMQQPQSICISGVALNVGHYTTTIYGGNVFLYLNGTSRGYIMQF